VHTTKFHQDSTYEQEYDRAKLQDVKGFLQEWKETVLDTLESDPRGHRFRQPLSPLYGAERSSSNDWVPFGNLRFVNDFQRLLKEIPVSLKREAFHCFVDIEEMRVKRL